MEGEYVEIEKGLKNEGSIIRSQKTVTKGNKEADGRAKLVPESAFFDKIDAELLILHNVQVFTRKELS